MTKALAGVSTLGATRLLNVVRRPSAAAAQRVGLVVPLTETRGTLRLKVYKRNSVSTVSVSPIHAMFN